VIHMHNLRVSSTSMFTLAVVLLNTFFTFFSSLAVSVSLKERATVHHGLGKPALCHIYKSDTHWDKPEGREQERGETVRQHCKRSHMLYDMQQRVAESFTTPGLWINNVYQGVIQVQTKT
jgi:hypothetical protein